MEEQHHEEEEEGEVQAEEQEGPQESEHTELQADAPAAFSTPREDGIATNIKIKEVLSHHA